MKIFVVGPEVRDCFTQNVAHAFRALGHDVRSMPAFLFGAPNSRQLRVFQDILDRASERWRLRRDKWSIKVAGDFKPTLTLVCTRTLEPETVAEIRKRSGGLVVCWYGDSPANIRRGHIVSGEYDVVFMKDKEFADSLHKQVGLEAHHLDEACTPAWHKPVSNARKLHLVVAGTLYGYRNAFLARLIERKIEVCAYGPSPSPWVSKQVAGIHTGRYLDHTNKANIFGEGLACLNTFAPAERNSLNCRIFETCGSGGLLLTERKEVLTRCFDPGKEFLDFSCFDECLEHIEKIKREPDFAEKIRAAAVRRAHGEHTYVHRLEKIMAILNLSSVAI